MGKFHQQITDDHKAFIEKQHIFFVATAPLSADGHVNLSPKGLDCFKVLSPHRVAYMDLISSGQLFPFRIARQNGLSFSI